MNVVAFQVAVERAAAEADFGTASAVKRGGNPRFPYVPVIKWANPVGAPRTTNPFRGLAYATREEAVARAQRHIDARRVWLANQLSDRRYRALREQYGLPREVPA